MRGCILAAHRHHGANLRHLKPSECRWPSGVLVLGQTCPRTDSLSFGFHLKAFTNNLASYQTESEREGDRCSCYTTGPNRDMQARIKQPSHLWLCRLVSFRVLRLWLCSKDAYQGTKRKVSIYLEYRPLGARSHFPSFVACLVTCGTKLFILGLSVLDSED